MGKNVLITLLLTIGFVSFSTNVFTQNEMDTLTVVFYNVENLFHPSNDSLTYDDDFTPTGAYHWSYKKYFKKINNLAKVLLAIGKGNPPEIVGLAEVENEQVLQDLCFRTPLRKYHYCYVHHDSPDRRGVDVALLYRDSSVNILHEYAISIVFPFEPNAHNRDLLYICAQLFKRDTIHLLVNHWTSRYGGYAATIPKRNFYAQKARLLVDSIIGSNQNAKILLMGDFNDYCNDESMTTHLRARTYNPTNTIDTLFNLMFYFENQVNAGSHKHEDFWRCLDQIIVSRGLLFDTNNLHVVGSIPHLFNADFLLVPDRKYGGVKCFRTFLGPRYIGGFSDHLPVFIYLTNNRIGKFSQ